MLPSPPESSATSHRRQRISLAGAEEVLSLVSMNGFNRFLKSAGEFAEQASEKTKEWGENAKAAADKMQQSEAFQKASEASNEAFEKVSQASAQAFQAASQSEAFQKTADLAAGAYKSAAEATSKWAQNPAFQAQKESIENSVAFQAVKASAEQAANKAQGAAVDAAAKAQEAKENTLYIAELLKKAPDKLEDREELIAMLYNALEKVSGQIDSNAQAITIGSIQQAGVGVAALQGTQIVFLPEDGPLRAQIRVSQTVGQAARLAVGASAGAYLSCFYGEREEMARPLTIRGADLGILVAAMGFFRAYDDRKEKRGSGWIASLHAGLNFGIPILSDFSAFELEEVSLGGFSLSSQEAAPLMELLNNAPDRANRRKVAQYL